MATRELIERILRTDVGAEFAKAVLGPKVERFNPGGSQEVVNTLMHPENQALAESFERRLSSLSRELNGKGGASAVGDDVFATEASKFFAVSRREDGFLAFADGETVKLRTAYESRRAEFLMGGETVPVRGPRPHALPAPPVGFHPDAFEQLLLWEELAGVRKFREGTQFFGLKIAPVGVSQVDVEAAQTLPIEIRALFLRGDKIYWPQHPFNADGSVPFANAAATESWPARLTASRSMVVWNKSSGRAFSLKAPTDHPHRTELQGSKVKLNDDIKAGVYRSEYMDMADKRLGPDRDMTMLREVFSAADKNGGNGFVVRDLSPLQDGNYYVPALSIPYVGPRIAELNGVAFDQFWEDAYARLLGRSKAKLLIRYGLQMETPNCQNMLIQFDRDMRPTGKLVFRDVSDSSPIRQVAEAMGAKDLLEGDARRNFEIDDALDPNTDNSFWRLDEDPVFKVPYAALENWKAAHDDAYVKEAMRLLGFNGVDADAKGVKSIQDLQNFLFSDEGKAAIAKFHSKGTR